MNKKLKKILEDRERTESKIAELQDQLKVLLAAQQAEENREIVKSIRGMKLSGRELLELLTAISDGTVTIQYDQKTDFKEESDKKEEKVMPVMVSESEDNDDDEKEAE